MKGVEADRLGGLALCLACAGLLARAHHEHDVLTVGRPFVAGELPGDVSELSRLTAAPIEHPQLGFAFGRTRRQEAEVAPVGAEARLRHALAPRQLDARVPRPVGHPQRAPGFVGLLVVARHEVGNRGAIGRDMQIGHRLKAEPILGAQGTARLHRPGGEARSNDEQTGQQACQMHEIPPGILPQARCRIFALGVSAAAVAAQGQRAANAQCSLSPAARAAWQGQSLSGPRVTLRFPGGRSPPQTRKTRSGAKLPASATGAMSAPHAPAAFEESRRRAHAALRAAQAATAEAWLRSLEAQAPGELTCLWLLGAALLAQDKITESIAILERVLAAAPGFAQARVDLARAYRCDGRAAQARAEVRRVLEKEPHHHPAWLAYADALVDLGQYDEARIAFERPRVAEPLGAAAGEAPAALASGEA